MRENRDSNNVRVLCGAEQVSVVILPFIIPNNFKNRVLKFKYFPYVLCITFLIITTSIQNIYGVALIIIASQLVCAHWVIRVPKHPTDHGPAIRSVNWHPPTGIRSVGNSTIFLRHLFPE